MSRASKAPAKKNKSSAICDCSGFYGYNAPPFKDNPNKMIATLLKTAALSVLLAPCLVACTSLEQQQQILAQQKAQSQQLASYQTLLETQQQEIQTFNNTIQELSAKIDIVQDDLQSVSSKVAQISSATKEINELPALVAEKPNKVKKPSTNLKPEKVVLGRVEWAKVELLKQYLKARIDTGAKSSSIHATNTQFFERDGERWVSFQLHTHEKTQIDGDKPTFESPLMRTVKIKQASNEGFDERAVIKLMVEVGSIKDEIEFTLTDRANMNYPILLGRNFLRDVAVVDVAKVFTRKRKETPRESAANM